MSAALRRAALAAVVLLVLVGVLFGGPSRELTQTTFGTVPSAYGALFDLLTELPLPVAHSYAPADALPGDATVWWIDAPTLCAQHAAAQEAAPQGTTSQATTPEEADWWHGRAWIEAGGTAVILLPPHLGDGCEVIGGVNLPPRAARPHRGGETTGEGEKHAGLAPSVGEEALVKHSLSGRITPQPRQLATSGLTTFEDAGDWQIAAELDGRPFVLEAPLGRGRLVLVADATFVRNAWLDHADAALVAVDLVRAYGVPRFDERAHGLRAEDSALRYLAGSSALPLFAGLALVAVLFAWRGAALPPRSLPEGNVAAPTLETFVDSLARLYAASRDHTRVLYHYRNLTAARLCRHFRLPSETPLDLLAEHVRGTRRVTAEALGWLVDDAAVSDERELRDAVGALDRLLWEATA